MGWAVIVCREEIWASVNALKLATAELHSPGAAATGI